jgi:hypothetical protein
MEVAMRAAIPFLLVSAFVVIPGPAASQRPGSDEILIYRDRNFAGPAVSIRRDESNLRLSWTVSSARVRRGTWLLCERPNFQGQCRTLTSDNRNLGNLRVQSARARAPNARWGVLGSTDVSRFGRDRRVIQVRGNQNLHAVRLCAERNRVRLFDARARFANNRSQTLFVPANLSAGQCTAPLSLHGGWTLRSVELTVSTTSTAARARIRLEGR